MGDIADWLVDQAMAAEIDPFYYESDYYPSAPKTKPTCKRCGKPNLIWGETGKGWRLYEGYDKPHVCQIAATADDFGDVK